jgi:hypothetical protein
MEKQLSLSLLERQREAEGYLDTFSKFTEYKHGTKNPYRSWLNTNPVLTIEQVVKFICFWYPVSRQQPQILLRCTASYDKWNDRKLMMQNYKEEDGMVNEGQEPHYYLLQQLIKKLDSKFEIDRKVEIDGKIEIDDKYIGDEDANEIVTKFHNTLVKMNPAQATGFIVAIEHPALDISAYFNKIVELCGKNELLKSDPYLTIHIDVEPDHIIWAHGNAERYMKNGKEDEVINAFKTAMSFWTEFWEIAFTKLGYQS